MASQPQSARESNSCQATRSTAFATLLAAIVILILLGHNRLTDWDEGTYAQISREMLHTGFLVPHWNSLVWIDKRPLTYWITALFFKLFGVSEFTARLGPALSAIAIIAVLHHWLSPYRHQSHSHPHGLALHYHRPLQLWLPGFVSRRRNL